jgi:hypothetical protein
VTNPAPDTWLARRRDDGTVLRARCAYGLLLEIREQYRVRPVPRS